MALSNNNANKKPVHAAEWMNEWHNGKKRIEWEQRAKPELYCAVLYHWAHRTAIFLMPMSHTHKNPQAINSNSNNNNVRKNSQINAKVARIRFLDFPSIRWCGKLRFFLLPIKMRRTNIPIPNKMFVLNSQFTSIKRLMPLSIYIATEPSSSFSWSENKVWFDVSFVFCSEFFLRFRSIFASYSHSNGTSLPIFRPSRFESAALYLRLCLSILFLLPLFACMNHHVCDASKKRLRKSLRKIGLEPSAVFGNSFVYWIKMRIQPLKLKQVIVFTSNWKGRMAN